ncbi:hypothetical protein DIPPA_50666, partial [Diplonema papillatum]
MEPFTTQELTRGLREKVAHLLYENTEIVDLSHDAFSEVFERFVSGEEDVISFLLVREKSAVNARRRSSKRMSIRSYCDERIEATRVKRGPTVTGLSGLPVHAPAHAKVVYLVKPGRVTRPGEVLCGVFTGHALAFLSTAVMQLCPEEGLCSTAIGRFASSDRCTAMPMQPPSNLSTVFESSKERDEYVKEWVRYLEALTKCSRPPDDTVNDCPLFELETWKEVQPRLAAVLRLAEQPFVLKAVGDASPATKNEWDHQVRRTRRACLQAAKIAGKVGDPSVLLAPLTTVDATGLVKALPGALRRIFVLRTLSEHYADPDNFSRFLRKVTMQIVRLATAAVPEGEIWEHTATEEGVENMLLWCRRVFLIRDVYVAQLKSLLSQPRSPPVKLRGFPRSHSARVERRGTSPQRARPGSLLF